MKTGTLIAVSAAALAIVGYAVWTMSADPGSTARRTKRQADEPAGKSDRPGGKRGRGGVRAVEPTTPGDARRAAVGGPAPKPVPKISLDTARKDFVALIDEYDALLSSKTPLDNTRWVELYAKGAEVLTPLQQHLSWDVPAEAAEMTAAQQKYRSKIDALQRQVVYEAP